MPYVFADSKPALVYEVYLPKKWRYRRKLREILDSFFSVHNVQSIPSVNAELQKIPLEANRRVFIEGIMSTIRGYSIYSVKGRHSDGARLYNEKTWVIRFIIHDPTVEGGIRSNYRRLAQEVINHLITRRFAEELGTEQEIWFIEYEQCRLRRWIKQSTLLQESTSIEQPATPGT